MGGSADRSAYFIDCAATYRVFISVPFAVRGLIVPAMAASVNLQGLVLENSAFYVTRNAGDSSVKHNGRLLGRGASLIKCGKPFN